jgi:hypothetical protein
MGFTRGSGRSARTPPRSQAWVVISDASAAKRQRFAIFDSFYFHITPHKTRVMGFGCCVMLSADRHLALNSFASFSTNAGSLNGLSLMRYGRSRKSCASMRKLRASADYQKSTQ